MFDTPAVTTHKIHYKFHRLNAKRFYETNFEIRQGKGAQAYSDVRQAGLTKYKPKFILKLHYVGVDSG